MGKVLGIIAFVALVCLAGALLFGVQVDVTKTCPYCGGHGTITSKVTCDTCGGDGKVAFGLLPCPDCGGSGNKMVEQTCSACNGRGYITRKVPLIEALIGEYT